MFLEALELLSVSCTEKLDNQQVSGSSDDPGSDSSEENALSQLSDKFAKVDVLSDSDGKYWL